MIKSFWSAGIREGRGLASGCGFKNQLVHAKFMVWQILFNTQNYPISNPWSDTMIQHSVYTTVLYSCMCSYVEQDRILHRWVNGHGWHKWQLAVRISEKVQTVLWEMLVIYTALWWWHYHQYIDWQSFQEYYTYNHNYPYLCCPIKEHEASLGTSKNSF